MRALRFSEFGPSSVLEVATVPDPHPGPGEVRIAVRAAGINPYDWKVRSGRLKEMMPIELPSGLGADAAGVVDEVGEDVEGVSVGDEVFGMADGGACAELAVLHHFAVKPRALSWEEAAGLGVATETALRVLEHLNLTPGQTLLIDGAAGGVGSAAAQFARADGLTVIGTASPSNHDYLRSLGVIPTTYGAGLAERVAELAPNGVDAAFDTAGKGSVAELVRFVPPEKVVSIADPTAHEHGAYLSMGRPGHPRAFHAFQRAAELAEAGEFKATVDSSYRLEEAAQAHDRSEEGHLRGKIVLTVE